MLDLELVAIHDEHQDMIEELASERIIAPIKSKRTLNDKMSRDEAMEAAVKLTNEKLQYKKTKGRFEIQAATNAGHYLVDRSWTHRANPHYKLREEHLEISELEKVASKH